MCCEISFSPLEPVRLSEHWKSTRRQPLLQRTCHIIIILFLFDRWRISHAKIIRCMNTSKDKIDRNKNVVSVHIRCSNCSAGPYCIHTILIVLRHPYKSLLTTKIYTTQRLVHIIYIIYIMNYDIYVFHYCMRIAIT